METEIKTKEAKPAQPEPDFEIRLLISLYKLTEEKADSTNNEIERMKLELMPR